MALSVRHEPGYIIIDTEGTGLFRTKNEDGSTRASDAPGQPRMAEFACVLASADFDFEDQYQAYIRPEGWKNEDGSPMLEMPEGAFAVNGLSMAFLLEHGIPASMALAIYKQAIDDGRAVLGFNQQHDGRQVRAELRHIGLDDMFERTKAVCAMRSIQGAKLKINKLNGKGGWPRLIDVAAHCGFPYPEDKRHTALEDALVTRRVGDWCYREGILLEPAVHYAKNYQGEQS